MKLTVEDDRKAIQRYGHLTRARGWSVLPCGARLPGEKRVCSREKGHRGPHAAHGWFGRVLAVWDSAALARPSAARDRSDSSATSRGGPPDRRSPRLPTRRPTGPLQALWARLIRTLSDVEGVALLLMFVAFVGFAVQWFLLLLE